MVSLWVALVGAVATVLATAITLFFTNRREAKRQEYEQERQEREIEERRWATLWEERLRAYSTFARLTKIVDPKNPSPQAALGDARSEIEMLADNSELLQAAAMVLRDWGHAWEYTRQKIEEGEEDP
jgi:flagellar biosynthesis/type III secretory pathway M-ring protein FliF/YscJ